MLHSDYASAAKDAITYVRSNVKYRGLNTGGGWIRNPLDVPQKFAARIDSVRKGNERSAEYRGGFNGVVYIDELEKLAKETGTGNCSELSAVAFNYLKRRGTRPIDYFGVFRGGWNHAFVILNRSADVPLHDFEKWSYDAVLCDPLYDRSADAGFLATWYPKVYPLSSRDLVYRIE